MSIISNAAASSDLTLWMTPLPIRSQYLDVINKGANYRAFQACLGDEYAVISIDTEESKFLEKEGWQTFVQQPWWLFWGHRGLLLACILGLFRLCSLLGARRRGVVFRLCSLLGAWRGGVDRFCHRGRQSWRPYGQCLGRRSKQHSKGYSFYHCCKGLINVYPKLLQLSFDYSPSLEASNVTIYVLFYLIDPFTAKRTIAYLDFVFAHESPTIVLF